MPRIIFHIDVNSAYLSWTAVEQLKNGAKLDIRTIPAIIGGDQKSRRGVVLAKSIPAKRYGIRTGEPAANAFRKCPGLHMDPPDHKLYSKYSDRLMEFLSTYTTAIEQVSVDECYMDFTEIAGNYSSPVEGAVLIKNKIREKFGFTVNIGISDNKLLAKMASDFEKPNKVHTLFPEEIQTKMWPLPVWELYMAGHSSVETLEKLEIYSIGDLAQTDPAILELHLKSHGRKLWEFANGIDNSAVESERTEAKGIGNSTTLPKDVVTEEEASAVLSELSQSVARRLKNAGQKAGMLSVEIKYYNFDSFSHQKQLEKMTNNAADIHKTALELFRDLWNKDPIRLLGIRSSKLVEEGEPQQLSIFDIQPSKKGPTKGSAPDRPESEGNGQRDRQEKQQKQEKLSKALEEIRRKYGEDAIVRGKFLK